MLDDRDRVGNDEVALDKHEHERLAAHRLDNVSLVGGNLDPFGLEPLVRQCERDPLDVRQRALSPSKRVATTASRAAAMSSSPPGSRP